MRNPLQSQAESAPTPYVPENSKEGNLSGLRKALVFAPSKLIISAYFPLRAHRP